MDLSRDLTQALIKDTKIEDISEKYRPIVDIIGVENFVKLSDYAVGDEIYFPKVDTILSPAKYRAIRKEFNGSNITELASKYDITVKRIRVILKNQPIPQQISIDDWLSEEKKQ